MHIVSAIYLLWLHVNPIERAQDANKWGKCYTVLLEVNKSTEYILLLQYIVHFS